MLLQTIKLQLKSCLLPFLLNIIFCGFCIVLDIIIIKFPGLEMLKLFSAFIYIGYFLIEFIYSFFYGHYNFTVVGRSYDSLKHDKHAFWLSSLLFNVINVIFVSIFFFIQNPFSFDYKGINLIFALIVNGLIHIAAFSFGSFYALFLNKYKILNKILISVLLILAFIFYGPITIYASKFIGSLHNSLNNISITVIIVIVLSIVSTIVFNILNAIKYKKQ